MNKKILKTIVGICFILMCILYIGAEENFSSPEETNLPEETVSQPIKMEEDIIYENLDSILEENISNIPEDIQIEEENLTEEENITEEKNTTLETNITQETNSSLENGGEITESSDKTYELQKSKDAINWVSIEQYVAYEGDYNHTDVSNGITYYRLNGDINSEIIALNSNVNITYQPEKYFAPNGVLIHDIERYRGLYIIMYSNGFHEKKIKN